MRIIRLVGGVFDGQNAEWNGHDNVLRIHRPRMESVWSGPRPESAVQKPEPVQYSFDVYRVRSVNVEGESLHFAAPSTWTDMQAFKHLLRVN